MNFKRFISGLFVMLFGTTTVVFASHIGRNIYGIYTETYNGVGIEDSSAGNDFINVWAGGPNGDNTADKIEGLKSYQFGQHGWASFAFGSNQNMSAYSGGSIYFSAKIPTGTVVSNIKVKIKDSAERTVVLSDSVVKRVGSSSTGAVADDAWHTYYIALSDFQNLSLTSISCPFIFVNDDSKTVLIDNVYWKKGSFDRPVFSVVRKKVSDNTEVTEQTISFSADVFEEKGWAVADQYFEIDIDGEMSNPNWTIRLFTNNTKAGLYNEGINEVLPTAWRAFNYSLPYNYIDDQSKENIRTLVIGENWQKDSQGKDYIDGLYDKGQYDFLEEHGRHADAEGVKWWYPWFYMAPKDDTHDESIIVKNSPSEVGCHVTVNTNAGITKQYYDNLYEKNTKVYIACDTKSAKSVKYTVSLIVNLSYE